MKSIKTAKTIYEKNIHQASGQAVPDGVAQYLFNAIITALEKNSYAFDLKQLRTFVLQQVELLKNKSIGQHIQFALDAKTNGGLDVLKKKIMDMYATNPTCAPQVMDLIKELDVSNPPCLFMQTINYYYYLIQLKIGPTWFIRRFTSIYSSRFSFMRFSTKVTAFRTLALPKNSIR